MEDFFRDKLKELNSEDNELTKGLDKKMCRIILDNDVTEEKIIKIVWFDIVCKVCHKFKYIDIELFNAIKTLVSMKEDPNEPGRRLCGSSNEDWEYMLYYANNEERELIIDLFYKIQSTVQSRAIK